METYPRAHEGLRRWFLDAPVHEHGATWVLSKMWGTNTTPTMDALIELAPADGFSYEAVA